MDTRCHKCAEPWDVLYITDEAESLGLTPAEIHRKFSNEGCPAMGVECNEETLGSDVAFIVSALSDILGDDVDGLASELDTLEYYGII
jgi:hypothetical protein